jgi:UDP-GlcNAc:undecaprenyl-phosphate/decaprenyl-phosphate GlcNAc-1-phosphate transferase
MRIIFYVLVGGLSAVVTFALAWLILKLSMRFRLYPKIRERDVHTRPTPRLGGVAMFIGVVAAFAVASQLDRFHLVFVNPKPVLGLLAAAFLIVLIGVADDIWDLDWLTKLAGQLIAAGILVWQGVQLQTVPIGGVTIVPPVTGLVVTVIAIVLVMNAVNFIDGLDGLVSGVAIIASGTFFIYTYILTNGVGESEYFNLASLITAALVGACVGFLPLNWHPAKLFMGDAGALLVGLLMAASAISVTGQVDPGALASGRQLLPAFIPLLLPFAVLIVPLLDFALAVIRRLRAGKSPFSADRKHLHHRLLDMGHSHFHAVLIFYAWTAVVSVGTLLFMFVPPEWAFAFLGLGFVLSAWVTLAPLTRSKKTEALAQRARAGSDADARLDPLDAASTGAIDTHRVAQAANTKKETP